MGTIVFGPQWFFGIDSIFEIISVLVALLVAWYSFKAHKLTSEAKYKTMTWAFLLVATGMALKILTNLSIYFLLTDLKPVTHVELLYDIGYFLARYSYILGLMLLLIVLVLQIRDKRIIGMFAIFTMIAIVLSYYAYYVYHGITIMMLLLIVQHYYKNYSSRKTSTSRCVFASFMCLLLAHTLFLLVEYNRTFYVVAEGVQLFGFLNLAANFIMIMRK